MGMYTEMVVKCCISPDAPPIVRDTLGFMFNIGTARPDELPDHPLFSLPRWEALGSCNSYYHIPWSASNYIEDYLFSRSDIKNYNGEIEAFFDWLRPHVSDYGERVCIGWSWYEECMEPTLIYSRG